MRLIYTLFFYLAVPIILLRLWWRARKAPAYRQRWGQRFGFVVPPPKIQGRQRKMIWLHTVSVGEFLGALPLIRQLLQNPHYQLFITTTTPTGSEQVRNTLGSRVFHAYAPYDLPGALGRFINRVKPDLLVIMETELWPNTIQACATRAIPIMLMNGRMSEKSARGYRRFAAITRPMLQCLTKASIQATADAQRLQDLGLPASAIQVTGNIKFDLTISPELRAKAAELKQQISLNGARQVLIAASTHASEDEILLNAFAQLRKSLPEQPLLLLLVPRHPERFDQVVNLSREAGFVTARRSQQQLDEKTQVLVGDTMGELMLLFGASDVAFVGGSLVPRGGHNFIEPAAWRLPLVSGRHLFNFAEVSRLLIEAGALQLVDTATDLAQDWRLLLTDQAARAARGAGAFAVAEANRGALEKNLALINALLG